MSCVKTAAGQNVHKQGGHMSFKPVNRNLCLEPVETKVKKKDKSSIIIELEIVSSISKKLIIIQDKLIRLNNN